MRYREPGLPVHGSSWPPTSSRWCDGCGNIPSFRLRSDSAYRLRSNSPRWASLRMPPWWAARLSRPSSGIGDGRQLPWENLWESCQLSALSVQPDNLMPSSLHRLQRSRTVRCPAFSLELNPHTPDLLSMTSFSRTPHI